MRLSNISSFFIILLTLLNYIEGSEFRIVNGANANIGNFPFQLSLRRLGLHICGAAILNENWAITAAHCVRGFEQFPSFISLRMGSQWRSHDGAILPVKQIHSHPSYNQHTEDFDVALLRVEERGFDRNDLPVSPIKLAELSEDIPDNTAAIVSGWGYQSFTRHILSQDLKYTTIYTVNQKKCQQTMRYRSVITNAMFCATARGTDSCQGDSGGPIHANGVLIGVVSWGVGCADPFYPGVYTRLSYAPIRMWIKIITKL